MNKLFLMTCFFSFFHQSIFAQENNNQISIYLTQYFHEDSIVIHINNVLVLNELVSTCFDTIKTVIVKVKENTFDFEIAAFRYRFAAIGHFASDSIERFVLPSNPDSECLIYNEKYLQPIVYKGSYKIPENQEDFPLEVTFLYDNKGELSRYSLDYSKLKVSNSRYEH
jgi:hypothetical protein